METKSVKGLSVLFFGLSFNLILTLASLGFTCYSLNRFDSRLTAVEQDLLATNSPYQLADGVIVEPTSTHHSTLSKKYVAKRAVDNPSMCRKCKSACLNLNVLESVSCIFLIHVFWAYLVCVITSSSQMPTDLVLKIFAEFHLFN